MQARHTTAQRNNIGISIIYNVSIDRVYEKKIYFDKRTNKIQSLKCKEDINYKKCSNWAPLTVIQARNRLQKLPTMVAHISTEIRSHTQCKAIFSASGI